MEKLSLCLVMGIRLGLYAFRFEYKTINRFVRWKHRQRLFWFDQGQKGKDCQSWRKAKQSIQPANLMTCWQKCWSFAFKNQRMKMQRHRTLIYWSALKAKRMQILLLFILLAASVPAKPKTWLRPIHKLVAQQLEYCFDADQNQVNPIFCTPLTKLFQPFLSALSRV